MKGKLLLQKDEKYDNGNDNIRIECMNMKTMNWRQLKTGKD